MKETEECKNVRELFQYEGYGKRNGDRVDKWKGLESYEGGKEIKKQKG
jgi:hypothetical protein